MTNYSKTQLKTFFENGDVPQGSDYANFIDSYVNIVDTANQTMAGPLTTTALTASLVSAGTVTTTTLITDDITINNNINGGIYVSGDSTFNAQLSVSSLYVVAGIQVNAGTITTPAINVAGAVSAVSLNVTGDVSAATGKVVASAASFVNGVKMGLATISAGGTTQGTATLLTGVINQCTGVVNGVTTGFLVPSNVNGIPFYAANITAVSANLWPPTGGQINAQGTNAAFPMAGNTLYTIIGVPGSAYLVR